MGVDGPCLQISMTSISISFPLRHLHALCVHNPGKRRWRQLARNGIRQHVWRVTCFCNRFDVAPITNSDLLLLLYQRLRKREVFNCHWVGTSGHVNSGGSSNDDFRHCRTCYKSCYIFWSILAYKLKICIFASSNHVKTVWPAFRGNYLMLLPPHLFDEARIFNTTAERAPTLVLNGFC